jgi:hypothetical protein
MVECREPYRLDWLARLASPSASSVWLSISPARLDCHSGSGTSAPPPAGADSARRSADRVETPFLQDDLDPAQAFAIERGHRVDVEIRDRNAPRPKRPRRAP